MSIRARLRRIEEGGGYAAARAVAELDYLSRLLRSGRPAPEGALAAVEGEATRLAEGAAARGSLSPDDLASMEGVLAGLGAACKALSLRCVGHAHIDMNWMWGYHETVAITIDTMRTALALLDRYPDFRFSQSQASVYAIIERHAPSLVAPIAARIAEGRWESLACQWVESDMVLPSGESLLRQMLYARRYMAEVYGAPDASFETVFLPDTFGYPSSTPEILASAGVRHLYHCRGAQDRIAYRWKAPTGREILAYRDPRWYNLDIAPGIAAFLPAFARDTGLESALCVYGVGDHGGGPTMRDIERLLDMAAWPLFPSIGFGDIAGFFAVLAGRAQSLPLFSGETDRLFTGCYSSQSRIKSANSRAQEALYEAELLEAASALRGPAPGTRDPAGRDQGRLLREAWVDTLFGQFHDILPGSGVRETRERALGLFQSTMASATSSISQSLALLAGTASPGPDRGQARGEALAGAGSWNAPRAEGAGAGYGAELYGLSSASRGSEPLERRFFLFNQLQWRRRGNVELVLWDWPRSSAASFYNAGGALLPSQLLEKSKEPYWGHDFARYLVEAGIEGFGFASVTARESEEEGEIKDYHPYGKADWLVEEDRSYVLENELLRAVFDTEGLGLLSLVDKRDGRELVEGPTASFRLVEEDAPRMTAWIVGRRRGVQALDRSTRVIGTRMGSGLLEQWIEYRTELPGLPGLTPSSIGVRVSLATGASRLRFDALCDWRELGSPGQPLRQLDFAVALAGGTSARSLRDIPFALAAGLQSERDSPATSFMAAVPPSGPVLQLCCPGRQSFRLEKGRLSVTLLRGSTDPDPNPETGSHQFGIVLSVHGETEGAQALVRESLELRHGPLAVSSAAAASAEPPLIEVAGRGVIVASLKPPEGRGWSGEAARSGTAILRLYETEGGEGLAKVSGVGLRGWRLLDSHERPLGPGGEGGAELALGAFGIATLELQFEGRGLIIRKGEQRAHPQS